MPNYQSKTQRQYRYDMIAKAEGEQCLLCYIEKGIRRGPPKAKLIIEHSDNIPTNWSWDNLHLACYSHNKTLEKRNVQEKIKLLSSYTDQLERERERENLPTWKTLLKDEIPYEYGPPEMRANKIFLKRWLSRVHQILEEEGSEKKKDLISRAAHFAKCSKQTSTNYLEVYTSIDSPFMETTDSDGNLIICYRINKA